MQAKEKLRVLQLCSSSATSGAERHVYSLTTNLRRRGHEVRVVCPSRGWLTAVLDDAGIPVNSSMMKGAAWYRTMGNLIKEVRRHKIHVVHTHLTRAAYTGHALGLLTRVPLVTSVHIANNDGIYRRLARRTNRLVAVSNYVAGMLHGIGVPDRYIDTVYNGTDFADIGVSSKPGDVKKEMAIPAERQVVGLVARICKDKGQVELIHAMGAIKTQHPNAHLMLVGFMDESYRAEVEDAIDSAGMKSRVTMTGVRHDIPRLMDSFAFTALPSYMETFGVVAIEAMARSRAVVATRVGALPEVVRDGHTGLLVDLQSDSIAEAVSYLLSNREECGAMGRRGRKVVEQKFTTRQMVNRFEGVYARAIAQN